TGYMAAEACNIQPGDVVAVWGCGPVGQFAIKSAYLLGAERVIAIDRFDYRLRMARERGGAETIDYEQVDVFEALREMTGGRGPDSCIDAVGLEGHAPGLAGAYDEVKTSLMLETDRPVALREAILACRSGGTISVAGVYGGFIDKFPMGAVVNRALTIRSGQTHVHRYMRPLLDRVRKGDIDPSFVADVKGDLSGVAVAGSATPKIRERLNAIHAEEPQWAANPAVFWDVFGKRGVPVRATISDLGPLLLGRLLDLNPVQQGVLTLVFKIADDAGLLLLDLKDLRAMLQSAGERASEF